jgi:hypothetical protein
MGRDHLSSVHAKEVPPIVQYMRDVSGTEVEKLRFYETYNQVLLEEEWQLAIKKE